MGLMPLHLYLYSGGLCEGDLEGKVPYKGTITSLLLMLIPCAIGIILNEKKHWLYHQGKNYPVLVTFQSRALRKFSKIEPQTY